MADQERGEDEPPKPADCALSSSVPVIVIPLECFISKLGMSNTCEAFARARVSGSMNPPIHLTVTSVTASCPICA
jgi:hypothetical protein